MSDRDRPFPIIKITFESMKQTLANAMHDHVLKLDKDIQAAIEAHCNSDALESLIRSEVRQGIDQAVKDEVQTFYRYGDGRKAIHAAVLKRLKEETDAP